MNISDYRVRITADTTSADRNINRTTQNVKALDVAFGGLKGAIAGAFGAVALTQVSRSLIGVYTGYEKLRTVLATTLGSQRAANAELERLQDLANSLPQDLQDITKAFVTMSRFGLDTTNAGLRAFSNIATASGKSMDQLAEALADAMTGEFERLKEFGIKVKRENDKLTASFGSQQVAVANSSEELVRQLQELGNTRFGSAAEENANTLSQSLSNLRGAAYEAAIAFMQGLAPALKINADEMAAFIRANDTLISDMGKGVGEALRTLGATARLINDNIDLIRNAILTLIGLKLFQNLQRIVANFSKAIATGGASTKGLTGALKTLGGVTLKPIISGLTGFVKFLGPFGLMMTAVSTLTILYQELQDETVQVGNTTATYGEIVKAVFFDLIRVVANFVNNAGTFLKALWTGEAGQLSDFQRFFANTFSNMITIVKGSINGMIAAFAVLFGVARNIGAGIALSIKAGFDVAGFITSDYVRRAGAQFNSLFDFISSGGRQPIINAFEGFGEGVVDKIKEEMQTISDSMLDVGDFIGRDFVGEAVGSMFDSLGTYVEGAVLRSRANAAEIVQVDDAVTDSITQNAATVQTATENVKKVFEDLRKSFSDIRSLDEYISAFNSVTALSEKYGAENEEVVRTFDSLRNSLRSATDEFENITSIQQYIDTLARWRAAQADGIITSRELGDSLKSLQGEFGDLLGAFEQLTNIDDFNTAFQYFTTLLDSGKIGADEYKMALDALAEGFDNIDFGLKSSIPTLAEYDAQLKILEAALEQGRITMGQFQEAKEELDQSFLDSEGLGSFINELGAAQAALSEDLANALLEGKNVMDSFKNFFKRMISQVIADIIRLMILQPLISSVFGFFGFTPQFGAGGSITSIGRRAAGGPVVKDKPYIVGERGPEMFVPTAGGTIVPNGQMGGGGVTQVTYNINATDARSFRDLIAADPEFIYSVSQAGSRRLPR